MAKIKLRPLDDRVVVKPLEADDYKILRESDILAKVVG